MSELVFKFNHVQSRIKLTKSLAQCITLLTYATETVALDPFWDYRIGSTTEPGDGKPIREVQYEPGHGVYLVEGGMVSCPLSSEKMSRLWDMAWDKPVY
jgi:hypothetical protein